MCDRRNFAPNHGKLLCAASSPLSAHLPEHLNPSTPTEGFLKVTTFSFEKKALSVMLPVARAFMSVADRKPILTCSLFLCYEGLEHERLPLLT